MRQMILRTKWVNEQKRIFKVFSIKLQIKDNPSTTSYLKDFVLQIGFDH